MLFRQLFEKDSSTYTYLLADEITKEAVLIDPVLETLERDCKLINELGLNLIYAINTHCHADHITSTGKMKRTLGFTHVKSVISLASKAEADIKTVEGDRITFGSHKLITIAVPGHTEGCTAYYIKEEGMIFTGDALMIRACGRTDFQGGSAVNLYRNVHAKLFNLPDETKVYPAHDYKGFASSTIGEERIFNPRLSKSEEEFVKIMSELNLPYPKKIDVSVPANLKCGV